MKAAIYARTAFPDQSTLPQINLCREYIQEQKGEIAGIYDDEGQSAHYLHRDGLTCLLEDADKGIYDTLVLTGVDKLLRDAIHLPALLNRFEERGINVVVVKTMAQSE